jgi:hypothetical protein
MEYTRILIIRFTNEIASHEIKLFRGAVIHALDHNNVLFHNHLDNKFLYNYPLIQYKRINKRAAIVCVNQGTDAIGDFFSSHNFMFMLGDRNIEMDIESVKPQRLVVQIWNTAFKYHIRKWLPLNSENYEKYQDIEGLAERVSFLEHILIGNILSFTKGLGIFLDKEVICKILQLSDPVMIGNKGVKLMSFDALFESNVSIPDYVGIGKNASINFGTVTRVRTNE